MAKIDFPESTFFNPSVYTGIKAETKKKQDIRKGQKTLFSGILEHINRNVEAEAVEEDLPFSEEMVSTLLDTVHSAGDDLKNRPLPEEILRYKTAVRNFLHYVVKYGYTAEKQVSGTNLLKRKNFTIVQVVDRKLEQLAAGILAGQTVQLEILARLEEITGLLVDLMQ
ncbi:MAG: DUF327 family protein [Treponema sp.]|jgi:uncharacterized protein YaaR (DUF327 family)|nr:DUF327 family protein [Treponema sp.]